MACREELDTVTLIPSADVSGCCDGANAVSLVGFAAELAMDAGFMGTWDPIVGPAGEVIGNGGGCCVSVTNVAIAQGADTIDACVCELC